MTIFNCRKCNKELLRGERQIAEKYDHGLCAQCLYFQCIKVVTITDYNNWLRKGKTTNVNPQNN